MNLDKNKYPIFHLRCAIDGIAPSIWRRVAVRADATLADLHRIVQVAFGWKDCHLHQFRVGRILFGPRDQDPLSPPMLDESTAMLAAVLPEPGHTLAYLYDFGDDWHHTVTLQEISVLDADKPPRPHCEAGARAAPPEDSGGVHGFAELLAAMADPNHPEHTTYSKWARGYDPQRFDRDAINRKLQRLPVRRPHRSFG